MRRAVRIAAFLAGLFAAAGACAQSAEKPLTPMQAQGKALFGETCAYCHRTEGFAPDAIARRLGRPRPELEHRTDLQPEYIRTMVKRGFRNMPAYTPTDLPAPQLKAVIDYLTRNNPGR